MGTWSAKLSCGLLVMIAGCGPPPPYTNAQLTGNYTVVFPAGSGSIQLNADGTFIEHCTIGQNSQLPPTSGTWHYNATDNELEVHDYTFFFDFSTGQKQPEPFKGDGHMPVVGDPGHVAFIINEKAGVRFIQSP